MLSVPSCCIIFCSSNFLHYIFISSSKCISMCNFVSGLGGVCLMAAYKNTVDQPWNTILMLLMLNILATWNDVSVKSLAIRVLDTNKLRGMGATVQLIGNNATATRQLTNFTSQKDEKYCSILFNSIRFVFSCCNSRLPSGLIIRRHILYIPLH